VKTGGLNVGVVGATGVAGAEIVRQLATRGFPYRDLRLFGTMRSAGSTFDEEGVSGKVELLGAESPGEIDIVFFAAGPAVALDHAPRMAAAGALVVDVSSAFRHDPAVPLVVPEVNGGLMGDVGHGIVAVPSPTVMVLAALLAPLGVLRRVTRAVVSTYQGAGTAGTRTLRALGRETIRLLAGREAASSHPPLAFECRPMIGALDDDGMALHERSVGRELGRVLKRDSPPLQVTAVRVPVFTGLGLSLVVELEAAASPEEISQLLRRAPGLLVHDGDQVPTLRSVAGSPALHVGRIRRDQSHPTAIALWAAADGVVKCRAGAAVGVAEIAVRGRVS